MDLYFAYPRIHIFVHIQSLGSHDRADMIYLVAAAGVPNRPVPCLLAARDGAKPNIFWMFCKMVKIEY